MLLGRLNGTEDTRNTGTLRRCSPRATGPVRHFKVMCQIRVSTHTTQQSGHPDAIWCPLRLPVGQSCLAPGVDLPAGSRPSSQAWLSPCSLLGPATARPSVTPAAHQTRPPWTAAATARAQPPRSPPPMRRAAAAAPQPPQRRCRRQRSPSCWEGVRLPDDGGVMHQATS